jgi:hypothetical protein
LFVDLATKKYLPEDRAEGCEDEYPQVEYAIRTLFAPYVEREQAQKARAGRWLSSPAHPP